MQTHQCGSFTVYMQQQCLKVCKCSTLRLEVCNGEPKQPSNKWPNKEEANTSGPDCLRKASQLRTVIHLGQREQMV